MTITKYEQKELKKFTNSFKLEDYQILTDNGYIDVEYLHETIPYKKWTLETHNGFKLECADDHIVYDNNMNEIFVKDLSIGDRIITSNGDGIVIDVTETDVDETMYDFQLIENSNSRYYTNDILSHNTHLAKQIAKYLFDSEDAVIRLDMSEYSDKINSTKLLGSSPGFVGYDEGSSFLKQVKMKPYSVILLDEIEKAHPDIFNVFLQMLDDGHLTDNVGKKISFKNCIIIMTSNVGAKAAQDFGRGIGIQTSTSATVESNGKDIMMKEINKTFPPEFINRINDIIFFKDLSKEDISNIVHIELDKLKPRLDLMTSTMTIDQSLIEKLIEVGYDPKYGARPLKRAIQNWVEDPIAESIIENNLLNNISFVLSYDKDKDETVVKFTDNGKEESPKKKKK